MKRLVQREYDRLKQQIIFIREIDQAKNVLRQNRIADSSRRENDAEHSWHLSVMALLLYEYADEPVDVKKVIEMLLIHDIVEIDAGDTFAYDDEAHKDKAERERKAAERIFGLLPEDQEIRFRSLWEEFEARESAEARFAAALDRMQPILLNYWSGGEVWKKHGISADQIRRRNAAIGEASEALWDVAKAVIDEAVRQGLVAPSDDLSDL